jgi:uncharacterized cofD-like protein
MANSAKKNIVVIGGGTGTFAILSGLKKYPLNLTVIVAMTDSGGSTGVLRDELGVLPPGDVARCLVALSTQDRLMRDLMDYRFDNGVLKGFRFGNLLLSALEKTTGSFQSAVERASDILRTNGRVIPATLDKVHLMARSGGDVIRGEEKIQMTKLNGSLDEIWLEPSARANPKALAALRAADAIIIGPGGFYTSLVTNLLVQDIPETIRKSRAKKIYVCNLMTKVEHTDGYSVADYTAALEKYLGGPVDTVIYNDKHPKKELLKRYAREGDTLTSWDRLPEGRELIGGNFLSQRETRFQKIGVASIEASLVRHDSARLAAVIARMFNVRKRRRRAVAPALKG